MDVSSSGSFPLLPYPTANVFASDRRPPLPRMYRSHLAWSAMTLHKDTHIEDAYVEIIGMVKDDLTIKALTYINLGSTLGEPTVRLHSVSRSASALDSWSSSRY